MVNHNSSEKNFNFNMLYVFSVVIIGLPGDDGNIEIYENDHEECFYIVASCFDNIYT